MKKYFYFCLRICVLVLIILPITGEGWKPVWPDLPKPVFLLPQKHSRLSFNERKGKPLYEYYCALCHGATGNGDGFNAYMLPKPPAKLSDPALMAKISNEKIKEVIKNGGEAQGLSPMMPAWGYLLKAKEIDDLTAYIRTLSKPGDLK